MPDKVIKQVNFLGRDPSELIMFTDRHGNPIGDHDHHIPGVPGDNTTANNGAGNANIPGVHPDNAVIPGVDQGEDNDNQTLPYVFEVDADDQHLEEIPKPEFNMDDADIIQPVPQLISQQPENAAVPVVEEIVQPEQDGPRRLNRTCCQQQRYIPSMQGNRYQYAAAQLAKGVLYPDAQMFVRDVFYHCDVDVIEVVMTQLLLQAAIKEWGQDATLAAKAAKPLHWRKCFQPVHRKDLTHKQIKQILESHMFLMKKRNGLVKAQKVAGGNKQQDYIVKEEASSPTAATESVLLSCAIDAKEGQQSAIVVIPNAFIQTRCMMTRSKLSSVFLA